MSESNSADHGDRRADSAPPCPPWRQGGKRLAWLPAVASLLVFLIGLSDILTVFKPEVVDRFHKLKPFVPGTLTIATRTSDVIVGLLLILLALGLRRRKRRAWQAVLALLVFDIVIHFFLHFPHMPHEISISITSCVAIVLLAGLL
jgi:lysyl-tRNA synthetase, class II